MTTPVRHPLRPSQLSANLPFFDRFAGRASAVTGRAPFFAFCVLLVAAWVPTVLWLTTDTWQLTIQTVTAIVTFLLVALLQNRESREDADALANLISALDVDTPAIRRDIEELRAAVGLEDRERS